MKIELEKEEIKQIITMMEGATIQMGFAEKALILLNKFKETEKENGKQDNKPTKTSS